MGVDCSPAVSQQMSEINGLNSKLAYDSAAQLQNQSFLDNQGSARAWEELKLAQARDMHIVTHMSQLNALISAQTGDTSDQQTTSPVRTGTGDAIVGSVGVSADTIAASQANLLTAMTPVIASAIATATSQTLAAILPLLIAAVGQGSGTSINPATSSTTK
jgi:hypothetical protein